VRALVIIIVVIALSALVPARARAQAEPAPESYQPPNRPGVPQLHPPKPIIDEHLPKWHLSVAPHLNFLFGDVPGVPVVGYGAGVQVARALIPIGYARLGVAADFAYDRFSHDRTTNVTSGTEFVAHALFAGLLVVDGIYGRIRPWLGLGGGFSVGDFQSPPATAAPQGVSNVGVAGLVKLALGLGVRVWEGLDIGLRGDFDLTISGANLNGHNLFQPGLFSLGLDLGFRF
jgi:hypothetical protein